MGNNKAVVLNLVLQLAEDYKNVTEYTIFEQQPFIMPRDKDVQDEIQVANLDVLLQETYFSEEWRVPYYLGVMETFYNKQFYDMVRKYLMAQGWARKVDLSNWQTDKRGE